MELKYEKIYAPGTDVGLKVTKGHFATNMPTPIIISI